MFPFSLSWFFRGVDQKLTGLVAMKKTLKDRHPNYPHAFPGRRTRDFHYTTVQEGWGWGVPLHVSSVHHQSEQLVNID